jgi:hypothetical protein
VGAPILVFDAITLTAPPHSLHVSMSMSPDAPTFGEHPLQALRLYALWVQVMAARRSAWQARHWG